MIKCVSFDLQGTITDADFCDSFWINVLPKMYAARNNISETEAIKSIKKIYGNNPKYNLRYYDDNYWTSTLEFDAMEELRKIGKKPQVDKKLIEFIKK